MTYWVNDLQRRIYTAVQGWDELLEEEHTRNGTQSWGLNLLWDKCSTNMCISLPCSYTDCANSEERRIMC